MSENVTFTLDSELYRKFQAALLLTGDTVDEAVGAGIRRYINQVLAKELTGKAPKRTDAAKDLYYGKANEKIPLWATRPDQYNHKIVRAYFKAAEATGVARLREMERLCSDKEQNPDLFVPKFKGNYASMKLDNSNSHGKVFEDDGDRVWIWDEVEKTLVTYKSYFYPGK